MARIAEASNFGAYGFISRFFRDRRLWDRLADLLFFSDSRRGQAALRVWSVGCAAGEEVYSLKILEAQQGRAGRRLPALTILATDKNPENLRRARQGVYPASSLKELPPEVVAACFNRKKGGRHFAILPFLTENITWRRHNLLESRPEGMFCAIFLRNSLLTYASAEIRKTALATILTRIEAEGLLVVGSHERLPEGFDFIERVARCPYVYVRH